MSGTDVIWRDFSDRLRGYIARKVGDFFDHRGLVDLIGDFVNYNRETVFADFFDRSFRTCDYGTTAFGISLARTGCAQNNSTCREIRCWNVFHQLY